MTYMLKKFIMFLRMLIFSLTGILHDPTIWSQGA